MKCVFHVKHNLQKKKSGGRQRAEERDRQRQTERQRERDRETGRETGGKKLEAPHSLKSNEAAQVQFEPQHPLVVECMMRAGETQLDTCGACGTRGEDVAAAGSALLCCGRCDAVM